MARAATTRSTATTVGPTTASAATTLLYGGAGNDTSAGRQWHGHRIFGDRGSGRPFRLIAGLDGAGRPVLRRQRRRHAAQRGRWRRHPDGQRDAAALSIERVERQGPRHHRHGGRERSSTSALPRWSASRSIERRPWRQQTRSSARTATTCSMAMPAEITSASGRSADTLLRRRRQRHALRRRRRGRIRRSSTAGNDLLDGGAGDDVLYGDADDDIEDTVRSATRCWAAAATTRSTATPVTKLMTGRIGRQRPSGWR